MLSGSHLLVVNRFKGTTFHFALDTNICSNIKLGHELQDDLLHTKIAGNGPDNSRFRTAVAALDPHSLANYLTDPTNTLLSSSLDPPGHATPQSNRLTGHGRSCQFNINSEENQQQ